MSLWFDCINNGLFQYDECRSHGKLGDKVGNHRLLVVAQFIQLSSISSVPMPLVPFSWDSITRFLFGLGTGALIPGLVLFSIKMTPKSGISRYLPSIRYSFYLGELSLVPGRFCSSRSIWLPCSLLCDKPLYLPLVASLTCFNFEHY